MLIQDLLKLNGVVRPVDSKRVIGIDEVGRGCLAGPVFACAVMLKDPANAASLIQMGVTDSKKLTASKRERLAKTIAELCYFAFGHASAAEVDRINILQATFLSMLRALNLLLKLEPDQPLELSDSAGFLTRGQSEGLSDRYQLLVDGSLNIPLSRVRDVDTSENWIAFMEQVEQQSIIQGDSKVVEISCASILAKVERDRLMDEVEKEYPGYGFESHKGYGSKQHLDAIQTLGPTPIHRLSFKGVKEFVQVAGQTSI